MKTKLIAFSALFITTQAFAWGTDRSVYQLNSQLKKASGFSFTKEGKALIDTSSWNMESESGKTTFRQRNRMSDGQYDLSIVDNNLGSERRAITYVQKKNGQHQESFIAQVQKGQIRSVTKCVGGERAEDKKTCVTASYPVCEKLEDAFGTSNRKKLFEKAKECSNITRQAIDILNRLPNERHEQALNRQALSDEIGSDSNAVNPLMLEVRDRTPAENQDFNKKLGTLGEALYNTAELCKELDFMKQKIIEGDSAIPSHLERASH